MYGSHGVCEILHIEQKRIDKKNIEYYVLAPIRNPNACFYIPTQNPIALSKLTPLLTVAQLQKLLTELTTSEDAWIDDENSRKQRYKEVIASGNQHELIRWVRALHIHRRLLLENGKKFHQADESFLRDAEKILTTEFSVIWDISEDAVAQRVRELVLV